MIPLAPGYVHDGGGQTLEIPDILLVVSSIAGHKLLPLQVDDIRIPPGMVGKILDDAGIVPGTDHGHPAGGLQQLGRMPKAVPAVQKTDAVTGFLQIGGNQAKALQFTGFYLIDE